MRVISADSHMMEPPDLWSERLDNKYRDRAPRVIQGYQGKKGCFGVYNDWVAEFCSYNPKRLFGIALISLEDIQAGAKELERCAKKGMRGAMIWGSPPRERPYSGTEYDPFWAAAQDLQIPVSLH